ncbi:MAG: hypothetical protein OEW87_10650, partial [Flavobacteriaceae bacterium]|nr:hypothetical protein [Flavobacteriaceae bacterium]
SYSRRPSPAISIGNFKVLNSFTRLLFSQKRKQIQSVLKQSYDKEKLMAALEACNISPQLRAETLNFDQILKLFQNLN